MEKQILKCAITDEICPYETDVEGCKPCKECDVGKEFLKNYIPLHDEV